MSVKRKKSGLVISWRKSFSILAPWRKGDAVTGSDVILTKMKLFNNFNERPLKADDCMSTISTVSDSDQQILNNIKVSEVNSDLDDKSSQYHTKSSSDYLSAIFSNSQLPRLYKFESEDSGVELNSGANSPLTPTSSEKSFVVHSREPSCDSCKTNSDHTSPPNTFIINVQSSEIKQTMDNNLNTREDTQSNLLSGLSYLQHICHLIENIGKLQETNLRLQEQICTLQSDHRRTQSKEDFFQEHCSCGEAILAYHEIQKKSSRSEISSPTGTLSDLSTIPEVTQQPLASTRTKRSLNRRSYNEGGTHFLHDQLSENYTWGRVKDIVRKAKVGNQNRLGLTSSSLKMSCPQLYPDLNLAEPAVRNRNSMIALGHQTKLDLPW
uniref:Si:ch211-250c4.4 n=1 Tax=Oryzias latipes TaxID=8090 RepID=A0A3B3H7A3_ORYLA